MDHPSAISSLKLLRNTIIWRREHFLIVQDYYIRLFPSCHFADLVFTGASFTQELHQFFRVPRLNMSIPGAICIKKHQLVQVFLSFLVKLLDCNTESYDPYENLIEDLEKDLRFLVTVLGDKSLLMYVDEHQEEFQNLTLNFEAVGNEAGSLICSLYSTTHRSFGETDVGLTLVLNHISLLKANILRFLDLLPCISKPAYTIAETSMVDSLVLRSVIHDLEDLIIQEDNRIADVKDKIKVLQQGLAFLQSSIKDVGRPSGIEELKELLKRSGNMAHQTEYLIVSFLSGDAPLWYLINRLTDINKKIELAGTELQEITKKHKLEGLKAAKHFNTQDKGNIEIDDVIVGFKDREPDVLDYLVGRGQSLRVISISGLPGLGKTCLAKKLFNHPSVNTWFDKQSWCIVSQKYESQSIQADILMQINGEFGKDSTSIMNSERLVVLIHKTLWERRYLIVMDDVWDSNLWDDLMRCFPDNGNGSRILFTTRDIHVGPSNCDNYALPSLSNEECWELLEKKVFGNNICPAQLIGIGKEIASNCWGLPLAVVVIAGILSTMDKEIHIWKEVRGNLASHVFDGTGDNSVMQILELSYKHLPERLKPCFLYFRAFIFHKKIRVRELLKLWISEGFMHKEGKSVEDVAEEYLMELIDKNLVMVAKRGSYGGVKTCVLHDLLRDLCSKICEDENFLKFEENIYSVYENGLLNRNPFSNCATWSYCQQMRTLHEMFEASSFFPGRTRLLRVFRVDWLDNHSTGVEYLVNLRYLVIGDIPESIGNLVNLEYLRVEGRIREVCLPPAILSMMKLRDLSAPEGTRYDSDCSTSRTNNLEFLSCISISNVKDEEMLKCSPNLRKLKCWYSYPSSSIDLCFLSHIESLNLTLVGPHKNMETESISFPSNIKKLTLSGRLILPWEKMSVLGRLEKLEVLKLGSGVFAGERWDMREGEFQKLKFFKLTGELYLREWNGRVKFFNDWS
ncbi:hypothetical protein ACS0TY_000720 [Phlomoides rotata]